MAVRRPLYLDGSNNLREMSDAQINAVKDRCRYAYGLNPSVTLTRVASAGSLASLNDTRFRSGAAGQDGFNFDLESETQEPQLVTVTYDQITETVATTTEPADTNNRAFLLFNNSGNVQAMTTTDMYDTLIEPAIDTIQATVGQPGTYRIHTATSLAGYTAVSTSPVFTDTKANVSGYLAANIGTEGTFQDVNEVVNNYYLLQANNIAAPSHEIPLFVRSDGDLQEFTQANFDTQVQNFMRHAAAAVVGTRIRHTVATSGTGTILGSGMVDSRITSTTGTYATLFVNSNDYRAQEFPSGTASTQTTTYLRMDQT